jgi:hypothetical protein
MNDHGFVAPKMPNRQTPAHAPEGRLVSPSLAAVPVMAPKAAMVAATGIHKPVVATPMVSAPVVAPVATPVVALAVATVFAPKGAPVVRQRLR